MKPHTNINDIADHWVKIFHFLGYTGKNRKTIYGDLDTQFGPENWAIAHFFDEKVLSKQQVYLIYEEAYYQFLKNNPDTREWLVNTASEVYDMHPSNIDSGLDYSIQECEATHLQDISVRRALTRLALEEQDTQYDPENLPGISIFKGDHPVQIRGHTSEGFVLNPGQVPFHKPLILGTYDKSAWWKEDSVEDAYQRSKVLLVDPDAVILSLAMIAKNAAYFSDSNDHYFEFSPARLDTLFARKIKEMRRKDHDKEIEGYCQIMGAPQQPFQELSDFCAGYLVKPFPLGTRKLHYEELVKKISP